MAVLMFMKSLVARFARAPAPLREVLVAMLAIVVYWIDITTPPYVFLTGYYLVPIFLAIWYCRPAVRVVVLTSSLATILAMTLRNIPAQAPLWQSILACSSDVVTIAAFVCVFFRLKTLFKRLLHESRTDPLTALRSRRGFLEAAAYESDRAARHGQGFALAVVDLDNFKHVNDTQGHAAGDALLVAASRCMTEALRKIDLLGRIGGDEFAIMLPEVEADEAAQTLTRLQADLRPLLRMSSERVSASIGAVWIPVDSKLSVPEMLERADAVMYKVKNMSKDSLRVELWNG